MKRVIAVTATAMLAVGIAAVVAGSQAGFGALAQHQGSLASAPQGTVVPGSVIPGPQRPTLTKDEEATAKRLFATDPRVQEILAGRQYTVKDIGPWTTANDHRKIGAIVILSLTAPLSGTFDWPARIYDPAETTFPPYQETVAHYSTSNASELLTWVDLNRRKVIAVQPGPGATITLPAGVTPAPSMPH